MHGSFDIELPAWLSSMKFTNDNKHKFCVTTNKLNIKLMQKQTPKNTILFHWTFLHPLTTDERHFAWLSDNSFHVNSELDLLICQSS